MKQFLVAILLCACLVSASQADEADMIEDKGFGSILKPIKPIIKPIPIGKPILPIGKPILKPIGSQFIPQVKPIVKPPVQPEIHNQNKRFLGSILKPIFKPINDLVVKPINNVVIKPINNHVIKPINNNVLKPILKPINNIILKPVIGGVTGVVVGGAQIVASGVSNVVNHVANGVTTAITVITDPLSQFGNELLNVVGSVSNVVGNQITNAVTGALSTAASLTLPIILLNLNQGVPNTAGPQAQPDLCSSNCFSRVLVNNVETDFYFDKPNGCIAKGINDPEVDKYFAGCCNQHSACLNSKCCTDNCQELKNQCDQEYVKCYRRACLPLYDDDEKYMVCSAIGSQLVGMSRDRVCSITNKANRKLCFCESD